MRDLLSNRQLRFLFAANFVSMVGSGMNVAAVNWYILQSTHSEQLLGLLVVVQALPSLLLMPFSGVIVDREDQYRVHSLFPDPLRGDELRIILVGIIKVAEFIENGEAIGRIVRATYPLGGAGAPPCVTFCKNRSASNALRARARSSGWIFSNQPKPSSS